MILERKEKSFGTIQIESFSSNGSKENEIQIPMRSLTTNWWRYLHHNFDDDAFAADLIRIDNTVSSSWSGTGSSGDRTIRFFTAHDGDPIFNGIRVGTSDTEMKITDYTLPGLISHGQSAGQLTHYHSMTGRDSTGLVNYRGFKNESGSDIDINEVGLFAYRSGGGDTEIRHLMFVRDVLDQTFTVSNGSYFTVRIAFYFSTGGYNMHAVLNNIAEGGSNNVTMRQVSPGFLVTLNVENAYDVISDAGIGQDNKGLLLGTGDAFPDFDDIDLDSRINHGSGAGQLLYGATVLGAFEIDEPNGEFRFEISRSVENDSGSPITVKEMGLFGMSDANPAMLDKGQLSVPVTISNGQTITARWRLVYQI